MLCIECFQWLDFGTYDVDLCRLATSDDAMGLNHHLGL